MSLIYMDNNATTRVADEVLEAMRPFLTEAWGNPSSLYRFGSGPRRAVDRAREQVAALIGASAAEIVFTSGGTESNNMAIRGAWAAGGRDRIVTSRVEHPAVQRPCRDLRQAGAELIELPVDGAGTLDPARLEEALRDRRTLVSIMWANNETGVCNPMPALLEAAARHDVVFHTDAVQAIGKVAVDVRAGAIDLLSLAAHKLHGPKGVGALYVRRGRRLAPLMSGGDHEGGLRPGTLNVPGIVGLGMACELAAREFDARNARLAALRDRLESGLLEACRGAFVNGDRRRRIPNTTNICFPGIAGESMVYHLDDAGIAVSSGSACSSGLREPSRVLLAMGASARVAGESVRFSLSRDTTADEIEAVIRAVAAVTAA